MNKLRLLKFIDKTIGAPLIPILAKIKKHSIICPDSPKKVLIIRPGGIGDAVLLLPSIDALKNKFHNAKIDILCEKRNHEIFFLSNAINQIYLYDRGLELFRCIKNKYDVVIDTEQWHRLSAVVAFLTGAPVRIGFATNERERLFTHRIPYSHEDYEVHSFFNLIEPLIGYIPEFNHNECFITIEDNETAFDKYLSGSTIVIFPGASVRERRWGGERFGHVARELMNKGYKVIVVGADTDKEDALLIKKISSETIDLTGKTSLMDVAYILKKSKLLITTDSGLLHLAISLNTPTVCLFGSGIEKKWAPRGEKHIVLNKHLLCSPCTKFGYTPKCKRNIECLSLITVKDVMEAAKMLLNEE